MTFEQRLEQWAKANDIVPESATHVTLSDESTSDGFGCNTCGYGSGTSYTLEISYKINGRIHYVDFSERPFAQLIRELAEWGSPE